MSSMQVGVFVATVVKKCFGHTQKKLYRSIYNFFEMAQNLGIFFSLP
jgi:hypothetical protein